MAFEQSGHLIRHWMLSEIRRDIGEPDSAVAIDRAIPQSLWPDRYPVCDILFRTLQLQGGIVGVTEQDEGRDDGFSQGNGGFQFAGDLRRSRPVAQMKRRVRRTAQ